MRLPDFKLTTKQARAYDFLTDKETTEVGYGGGAGGGKSYLGTYWVFSQCMHYPGVRYLLGRKELTNLKKTTLTTFFKMVGELGYVPTDIFHLNYMTNIINFKNGSEIVLMDMAYKPSDPEYLRFGGLELTGAFVDESNESEEKALEILKTRIGRQKNDEYKLIPKLLETFNPSKNHVYFRYYKPYKEKKQLAHVVFIPALVTDNPYLNNGPYIEQLKKADKITRERLLHGNFDYDDDPTKWFGFDNLNKMFGFNPVVKTAADFVDAQVKKGVAPENVKQYVPKKKITVDVARFGNDLTTILCWKDLYVYRVKYFPKNDTKDLVKYLERLCAHEAVHQRDVIVDEDGVGGGVVDFLKDSEGFVNNSRAIEVNGEKQNYKNLKAQCYKACADAVNSGIVGVYGDCPVEVRNKLIEDLEQIKRANPDKDEPIRVIGKDKIKELIGRSPDFGDAFMMRWKCEFSSKLLFGFA